MAEVLTAAQVTEENPKKNNESKVPKFNVSEIKKTFTPSDFLQKIQTHIKANDLISRAKEELQIPGKEKNKKENDDEKEWVFLQKDSQLAVVDGDLVVQDPKALGSMFIWIADSDVIEAIAYCVAQSIVAMPRVRNVEPQQLQGMIDKAFYSIKQKCATEKVYDWGKFMYSVYGWGNMAYGFATNPAVMCAIAETTVTVLLYLGF